MPNDFDTSLYDSYSLLLSRTLHHNSQHLTKLTAQLPGQNCTCNCFSTRYLKLYCDCFARNLCCSPSCNCRQCLNKDEKSPMPIMAVSHTLGKNLVAFKDTLASSSKDFKGCTCRKSECLKKYCECYSKMLICGSQCKCVNWYGDYKQKR